jgi:hypothetical protein
LSIWASTLGIEDERQWKADLKAAGIGAGIIRDGGPDFDDLDAPIIYQGSHILPDESHARGGSVDLAVVPAHVRYWRENPDGDDEPEGGCEPYLRLSVHQYPSDDGDYERMDATVVLTRRQGGRLRDAINEWLEELDSDE